MSKQLRSLIQVGISLALGFFLIWIIVKDLTAEDKEKIFQSFSKANYWWIVASSIVAILSHYFRGYRWKYTLEPLNMKIDAPARFMSVMVGYLANLAFPRLGEVSRCALVSKSHNLPFDKVFGTVVAERFIDALILLGITGITIITQLNILNGWIVENLGPRFETLTNSWFLMLMVLFGISAVYLTWRILQKSTSKGVLFIREKVNGLVAGFKTLSTMKNKIGFYFFTALIWLCYMFMHWLNFHCFQETAALSFGAIMASFTLGGLTIVAVQGGLGAYPLAIMAILVLYGVNKDLGYAFGWIAWTSQTIVIVVVGFVSLLLMSMRTKASIEQA